MTERAELITDHVEESDTALELLHAGIPLTLLLDLAMPIHSTDTYKTEPGAADWLDAEIHVARPLERKAVDRQTIRLA
jgi:hypothetical protein